MGEVRSKYLLTRKCGRKMSLGGTGTSGKMLERSVMKYVAKYNGLI